MTLKVRGGPADILPEVHHFDFSQGAVDLEMNSMGEISFRHCCLLETNVILNFSIPDIGLFDSYRRRMHIIFSEPHYAKIVCPACTFAWRFPWYPPRTFNNLVDAIRAGETPVNTLMPRQ